MPDDNLKKLIEQNLALTEEMFVMVKKIRQYIIWTQVVGIIKIILILAPIIFAIMYLPPYIKKLINGYQDVLPKGLNLNLDQSTMDRVSKYLETLPKAPSQ
ncbi:MAG: hypothetical protein V1765_01915 [bacterium]